MNLPLGLLMNFGAPTFKEGFEKITVVRVKSAAGTEPAAGTHGSLTDAEPDGAFANPESAL